VSDGSREGGQGPDAAGSGSPGNASATRVVVVEDQPDIASALRELVESDGSAVVVAVCHTLAIGSEMVERFRPDVVLTDFRLPDGDAVDQFAVWRHVAPETRILVASAWTDDRSLRRAMAAGASGYVEKGHELMELSAVIGRVMTGDSVWPERSNARPHHTSVRGRAPSTAEAAGGQTGVAVAAAAIVSAASNGELDPRAASQQAPRSIAQQVLAGVLAGRSTEDIAAELGLTGFEVRQHVNTLLRAAGVRTRAALRERHGASA